MSFLQLTPGEKLLVTLDGPHTEKEGKFGLENHYPVITADGVNHTWSTKNPTAIANMGRVGIGDAFEIEHVDNAKGHNFYAVHPQGNAESAPESDSGGISTTKRLDRAAEVIKGVKTDLQTLGLRCESIEKRLSALEGKPTLNEPGTEKIPF